VNLLISCLDKKVQETLGNRMTLLSVRKRPIEPALSFNVRTVAGTNYVPLPAETSPVGMKDGPACQ
jgi:hypothetical protein